MVIDGTYCVAIQAPGQTAVGILRIKAEGGKLNGTYEAHDKQQPLTGTIKGDSIHIFTAVGSPPQQKKLEFKGTVSENEINGGASADGSEMSAFKAKRD
jgi:hypothetical protein